MLGQLEVRKDGRRLDLGGPKQRALVAMLLLAGGAPVSVPRLLRGLWFDPPARGRNVIQVYASRLRVELPIRWTPAGYELNVRSGMSDLGRVLEVCASESAAAPGLRGALEEWRSEPLAEFNAEPFAEVERLRLAEIRLQLLRRCLDMDLADGRHHEVIGELQGLVAEFPFHEWLWERLVLSLYRSGRQGDALATIDRVTKLLRSELGVDPVPALRAMREQILGQDELLTVTSSAESDVTSSSGGRTRTRAGDRHLVLTVLERSATSQRPALVTILASPGMGKTHLLAEIQRQVAEDRVLVGRSDPDASGGGLEDLVTLLAGDVGRGSWALSLASQRLELHRRLEARGHVAPFVLLVDDAHETDDAVLDAIEHIPTHVHAPVVVIVTARGTLLERRPAWASATPSALTIRLAPLSDDEATRLCREQAGPNLPLGVVERVVAKSGGNPLALMTALARVLGTDGRPVVTSGAERLDALEPRARLLAGCAAVLGEAFDLGDLDRVRLGVLEGDLEHLVDLLASAGILQEWGPGRWRFSRALARETALGALTPARRGQIHANAVALLVDSHRATNALLNASSLAHHLHQADLSATEDLLRLATDRLAGYGRHLLAQGDAKGALRSFEAVITSLEPGDQSRLSALSDLGASLADVGELTEAATVLSQAMEEAAQAGDQVALTRAIVERDWLRIDADPNAETFQHIGRRARRCVATLTQARDLTGLARARLLLSALANLQGRRREQVKHAELVLYMPKHQVSRRDWSTAVSLVSGGMVEGPYAARALLERARQLRDLGPGDPAVELAIAGPQAVAHAMLGQFPAARRAVVEGRALADELDVVWVSAMLAWRSSQVEDLAGHLDAAERDMRFAMETYRRMGERSHLSTAMAALADLVARRGRLEEARELIAGSRAFASKDDVASQVLLRLALARTALAAHDPTTATQAVLEATAMARTTDLTQIKGELLLLQAEAAFATGLEQDARRLLQSASRLLRRKESPVLSQRVNRARLTLPI